MAADDKKASPKKEPATESKAAEAAPKEAAPKTEKPDAAPGKKGMGEGQKPVTQAYKDNWNAIFGKKKRR